MIRQPLQQRAIKAAGFAVLTGLAGDVGKIHHWAQVVRDQGVVKGSDPFFDSRKMEMENGKAIRWAN